VENPYLESDSEHEVENESGTSGAEQDIDSGASVAPRATPEPEIEVITLSDSDDEMVGEKGGNPSESDNGRRRGNPMYPAAGRRPNVRIYHDFLNGIYVDK
jgi:hypothetical protein